MLLNKLLLSIVKLYIIESSSIIILFYSNKDLKISKYVSRWFWGFMLEGHTANQNQAIANLERLTHVLKKCLQWYIFTVFLIKFLQNVILRHHSLNNIHKKELHVNITIDEYLIKCF